ncbi:hypothetical protein F5148DRAFT_1311089 [Russula earlei]|uniref:Uncharacterized protein n=1 Tax=Russula earlei TaxID=71964 RepID=A0ACC0TSP4_9AGAM|nr:hypothetical protein F5148DRAFT_1311089 [Russula earlei]
MSYAIATSPASAGVIMSMPPLMVVLANTSSCCHPMRKNSLHARCVTATNMCLATISIIVDVGVICIPPPTLEATLTPMPMPLPTWAAAAAPLPELCAPAVLPPCRGRIHASELGIVWCKHDQVMPELSACKQLGQHPLQHRIDVVHRCCDLQAAILVTCSRKWGGRGWGSAITASKPCRVTMNCANPNPSS